MYFYLICFIIFRFNVLTRGSLFKKMLAYTDTGLLVNNYVIRRVSTKLDKELEKGLFSLVFIIIITLTSSSLSVSRLLMDRGLLFDVRRHAVKYFVQVQTGPSTAWRRIRKPEDLSLEERAALSPYQWHHLQFLRVSFAEIII